MLVYVYICWYIFCSLRASSHALQEEGREEHANSGALRSKPISCGLNSFEFLVLGKGSRSNCKFVCTLIQFVYYVLIYIDICCLILLYFDIF